MEKEKKKLFIFDFDGVLSIPYSDPEKHYKDVPSIIKECSNHGHVAIASYNPVALEVIKSWGLSHLIITGRAGYNHKWSGTYNESMRRHMTKYEMINNIMYEDLLYHNHETIVFFDDDPLNIDQVKHKSNIIFTELIDSTTGITWEHVQKYFY